MHSYAQTNIQLFNQLRQGDYSTSDLIGIRNSYELAMELFTGRFQASGKPFLAHVVGTASILGALRVRATLVAAGLIHSVYANGEFGDGVPGVTNAKRQQVIRVLGREIEAYAARFETLAWGPQVFSTIPPTLSKLDAIDRDVIVIHLADHLEHQLDLEVLYYRSDARRSYMTPYRHIMVEIAEKLGLASLAAELKQAYRENDSAEVPQELRNRSEVLFIPPKSCWARSIALDLSSIHPLHGLRSMIQNWMKFRSGE